MGLATWSMFIMGVLLILEFHKVYFSELCFSLMYINDLNESLQSNPKLADYTSLFTIINVPNATAKHFCEDLNKITE